MYFHFFFFPLKAQAYSNRVDCFTRGRPPHRLDFNPTEALWERSLSCRQVRVLARMQWNSRQKYMFSHCIRVFKRCHFSSTSTSLLILGSDAGCNVCTFECSGVCGLTVQIRLSYRGWGYLSHSHLMASSCNMWPESGSTAGFVCLSGTEVEKRH